MDQISTQSSKKSLPVVGAQAARTNPNEGRPDVDVEAELRAFEESERQRLGMKAERRQWVDSMLDLKMTRKERDHVTLLIAGLTAAQDFLCEGALGGLGYKVQYFGVADNAGLQVGKEFGNRGQCNPRSEEHTSELQSH